MVKTEKLLIRVFFIFYVQLSCNFGGNVLKCNRKTGDGFYGLFCSQKRLFFLLLRKNKSSYEKVMKGVK